MGWIKNPVCFTIPNCRYQKHSFGGDKDDNRHAEGELLKATKTKEEKQKKEEETGPFVAVFID